MKHFIHFKFVLLLSFFFFFSYGGKLDETLSKLGMEKDDTPIQTLFSGDSTKLTGAFGGPFVSGLFLPSGNGVLVGGEGAFIFNDWFVFGGYGAGFVGDVKKDDYKMGMGFGGLYLEGIFNLSSPIHLAFATYAGVGGFGGKKNDDKVSKAGIILNPELNLELNIAKFLIIAIGAGYQVVFADFDKVFEQKDFSGVTVSVSFKFGKF